MNNIRQVDIRGSLSLNIKWLTGIGIWLSHKNKIVKKLYPLYTMLIIGLFYTSFIICQFGYLWKVRGNVEEMVGVLVLMVSIIGEYVKMFPLIFKSYKFQNLLNYLENDKFQPRNEYQQTILTNAMEVIRKSTKYFITICIIVSSSWGFYPLFDGSYKDFRLPMMVWVPFDMTKNNRYIYVYIYTHLGLVMASVVNSVYDTFMFGFMIHVRAQLDILCDTLMNIKRKHDMDDGRLEEELVAKITNCVKHHMDILSFATDIENLFSPGVMAEFCAAGFVFVVTLFQMTLVSLFSFQFIILASYFSCILGELFMYCWFGNEVILKSLEIADAAFKSDWLVHENKKYRKMLLILMIRVQKPIIFKAGNLIPLSIDTFTTILKSSWSYFNLLQRMNADDA